MSTSRLLSFLIHCKEIALLMDCDHVLCLQLESERRSVWRKEIKERKITRSDHRNGLKSLFPAAFNRGKPSRGNHLVIWVCLRSWVVGQGLLKVFHSSFRERKAVTSALGPPLLCGLESWGFLQFGERYHSILDSILRHHPCFTPELVVSAWEEPIQESDYSDLTPGI